MNIRCRLGLHEWGCWRVGPVLTTHYVVDHLNRRYPEKDFETQRDEQRRKCQRCGLRQRRRL